MGDRVRALEAARLQGGQTGVCEVCGWRQRVGAQLGVAVLQVEGHVAASGQACGARSLATVGGRHRLGRRG